MKEHFKKIITFLVAFAVAFVSPVVVSSPQIVAQEEAQSISIDYSKGFTIEYIDQDQDIKLVTDGEGRNILLVPKEAEVPEGYDDAIVVRTPVENVLFASATQVALIRPLDVWDSIGGVTLDESQWTIEEVKTGLEDGSIRYVDGGGYGQKPNYEQIQDLNPDITFVYTGSSPQTELIEMLEELDLPYAVDNEYMEDHYLGRLEWIKFLGAFYNKEEIAQEYFDQEVAKLDEALSKISDQDKPKVAWGQVFDGQVYASGKDSYVGEMVNSAGGELVHDLPADDSAQLSLEDFYSQLNEADVWIVSSSPQYLPDYQALFDSAEIVKDAKVVKDKAVWQYTDSYFQDTDKAVDHVIDLAAIFYPDLFDGHEFVGFQKLAE